MISGAMRGKGGRALSTHLLKPENDDVMVIEPRGLGSENLHGQLVELVALSLGGRTDAPIYHVHANPDPGIADTQAALTMWWRLFETEFGLSQQPYCGAQHIKHGRHHEHRIYSLVRPNGAVVDLRFDFARREKVSRIVEHAHGLVPVPSKHARSIEARLRQDGRTDVADWLVASGSLETERPVAPLSPQERLIQERTGISLDDVRAAALAAWRETDSPEGFQDALRRRGLDVREGRAGPVIVDAGGTAHLATRLIGAASRRADGTRIPAAAVRERSAGLPLGKHGENDGRDAGDGSGASVAPAVGAGARSGADAARGRAQPGEGPHHDLGGLDGGGGRRGGSGVGDALDRLRARPVRLGARLRMGLRASAGEAFHHQIEQVRGRQWIPIPGQVDIWGLPIVAPDRRV